MEEHGVNVPNHLIHGRHPCSSCPFRVDGDGWFDPDTLDHSVGDNSSDVPIHTSWDDVLNAHEARMLNDLDESIASTVPPQGQAS